MRRAFVTFTLGFVALTGLALTGCGSPPERDISCSVDEDCGANWICDLGECVPGYRGDFDGFGGGSGTSGNSGAGGTSGAGGSAGAGGTSGTSGTSGAGGTSGTSGTAGTSGTGGASDPSAFDPDQVYLIGGHSSCESDTISPVDDIATATVGFGCGSLGHWIRPTDGRVVYATTADDEEVFEFDCDYCGNWQLGSGYPQDVHANDTLIVDADCDGFLEGIAGVLVFPDTGAAIYKCDYQDWEDETGAVVYTGSLLGVGAGFTGLTFNLDIVDLSNGNLTPPTIAGGYQTIRSRALDPSGFWLLREDGNSDLSLWQLDSAGIGTELGVYPSFPSGNVVGTAVAGDMTLYMIHGDSNVVRLFKADLGAALPEVLARSDDADPTSASRLTLSPRFLTAP